MKKQITVGVLALVMTSGVALAQGPHGGGKMMPRSGDGAITKESMEQRQAERFTRMDTDSDGRLSVDELHAGLLRERAERMHRWLDRDGDGFVSAEELAAPQNRRFAKIDANGDGMLDKEELRSRRHMKNKGVRGQKAAQ